MENENGYLKSLGVVLVLLLGVGIFGYWQGSKDPRDVSLRGTAFSCQLPLFSRPGVASSTIVTTGNNMVLPTSTIREYVQIINIGNEVAYFNFGNAAGAEAGYALAPSSTMEISPCGSLYTKNSIQATTQENSTKLNLFFKHVAE